MRMMNCLTSASLQLWRQQSGPGQAPSNHACTTRVERLHKRPRIGPIVATAATLEAPPAQMQPPPAASTLAAISQRSARGPGQHQRVMLRHNSPAWTAKGELATGLAVTWLGTSSGAPTAHRNVSCTIVRLPDSVFLVDCGEGSLRQLLQTSVKLAQVDAIFITHLHGDHCFGIGSMLPAICAAKQLAAAEAETPDAADAISMGLRVYGPPGIVELLRATLILAGAGRSLTLPLTITEFVTDPADAHPAEAIDAAGMFCVARQAPEQAPEVPDLQERLQATTQLTPIMRHRHHDNNHVPFLAQRGAVWTIPGSQATVRAAQLQHRVPCWGYVFEELLSPADVSGSTQKPQQAAPSNHEKQHTQQQTPVMQALQRRLQAARQTSSGPMPDRRSSNASAAAADVMRGSRRPRKVVILGDTMDSSAIAPLAVGADVLAHEATFQQGMEGKAVLAQHSTAWMAGQFAAVIGAKVLVLTHFSARYHGLEARGMPEHPAAHKREHTRDRPPTRLSREQVPFIENSAEAQEAEAVQQLAAVQQLVQEAAAMHPKGKVLAAKDMWTYAVPLAQ